ncbi:M20 family metallopeptidase Ecym_7172 [Eremothecium cymbalariae DBVPG|uniref:Peptidase M20 dimerisation domain-containing protein n=1 Tax=Eremothecium cymbalariae (strain CBS 270.75 / DBVPG 7215 / KCTC 17166 / NRRL Y-17582) TaxID=931890 RepID=G8JW05_ERECY|nr:hypothetical protein Ecym_7172 [Eremothecium cymbalariae DBVPG\
MTGQYSHNKYPFCSTKVNHPSVKWILPIVAIIISNFGSCTETIAPPAPFQCKTYEKLCGASPDRLGQILMDSDIINATVSKLQNAVRIPTETIYWQPDSAQNVKASDWGSFKKMHQQLADDFPTIWSNLHVETVNTYGLLITWDGLDQQLEPLLFSAHMDVVPVDQSTWDEWQHPPFSGDISYDSEQGPLIWGRGSFDDKNMMIGILQAIEQTLLDEPYFLPTRSVIVALGFDEETGGKYGAAAINDLLLKRYGQNGIYAIVDEGMNGIIEVDDVLIATPATSEKGQLNLWFNIIAPGGHSSVPPEHTAIGMAAQLIRSIEEAELPMFFTEENPATQAFRCIAEHSTSMSRNLKWDYANAMSNSKSRKRIMEHIIQQGGRQAEYLLKTSKSVNLIEGGFKGNALPDSVRFYVDTRLAMESTVNDTIDYYTVLALDVADRFDLGLQVMDNVLLAPTEKGNIIISGRGKEPSPVSPENDVWGEFVGALRGLYEDVVIPLKFNATRELVVAPSIVNIGTDSTNYWKLTENIYRFQPGFASANTMSTVHSVNEHVNVETVMHVVAFVYNYIHAI